MLDGLKQLGSGSVQALGGLVVAHGISHGVQRLEGNPGFEERGCLGKRGARKRSANTRPERKQYVRISYSAYRHSFWFNALKAQ
jgi:hypothetical protein